MCVCVCVYTHDNIMHGYIRANIDCEQIHIYRRMYASMMICIQPAHLRANIACEQLFIYMYVCMYIHPLYMHI